MSSTNESPIASQSTLHVVNVMMNLLMVLVVGGTTIVMARSFSNPLPLSSAIESHQAVDQSVPEALFQPGYWVVEGLPWRFDTEIVSEERLTATMDQPMPRSSSTNDFSNCRFDSTIVALRRQLKVLRNSEHLTVLGTDTPLKHLRVFLENQPNGEFTLLGGRFATRQGPKQWTVLTAKLTGESSRVSSTPLLPLLPESRIVSTRLGADGMPQAELLTLTTSVDQCISLWREKGLRCEGQSLQRVGETAIVTKGQDSIRVVRIAENRLALLRLTNNETI